MVGLSHLVVGASFGLLADTVHFLDLTPSTLPWVLLGALLPDIDHPQSILGRRFLIASAVVRGLARHRGPTHSLLALVLVTVGLGLGLGVEPAAAVGVGYLSHLVADGLTVSGVPLLWPLPGRWVSPLAFRTGSPVEMVVVAAISALAYSLWDGTGNPLAGLFP